MKKIIVLLLIFSLSLTSCNFTGNAIEVWSRFDEFDEMDFDFDQYITNMQANEIDQITSWKESGNAQIYQVAYSDQSILYFDVCNDIETAKSIHQKYVDEFIGVRAISPLMTSIRIDNIVVRPNADIISNERLIHFARSIGIKSDQIVLNKINKFSRIIRKDTEKTFESILKSMEERGYSLIDRISIIDEDHQICTYVSDDNSTVYEIFMISGDQARSNLYYRIRAAIIDFPHDHVHVYYSIGDDYCMYFMGSSIETSDFWNEIR